MYRPSSLPSMPRGLSILLCTLILTNHQVIGTKNTVIPTPLRDWFLEATKMPQEFFISEADRYAKEQETQHQETEYQETKYYQYGEAEYVYDNDFLTRMVYDGDSDEKRPEHQTVPCVGGRPCPNSTDNQHENTQSEPQRYVNDLPSDSWPSLEVDENEPSLPEQNAPCIGGGPCQNSTEMRENTNQISEQGDANDHSPRATLEEVPNDKSAPVKKAPCTGGSPCPSARITREEMERSVYERVRNNILKQLNMKEPPNVSARDVDLSSPPIQRILRKHGIKDQRRLDEELVKDGNGEDMTTKETVISNAKPQLIHGLSGMHFTFSEDDMTYSVKSAVLWLHVNGHRGKSANATLEFYRYQEARNGSLIAVKFNKKKIKVHQHGMWRKFIITNEVSRWFINSSSNYGIDVRCPEFPDIISGVEGNIKKPVLEVQVVHSQLSRRRKRSASLNCDPDTEENSCCRHNLTVSFRNLGWDWVIGPSEFQSYHCYGDCMFLHLQGNYQRMHYMSDQSPSKSCCSPTKMSPIKLLYFDHDHNIIFSQVDDMVIQKCGCV